MFRAKLPSIFNTSHKMPRLPRNLHLVTTWPSPDNAIRKNHDAKWRWTRPKCCACHENWNTSSENIAKVCKSIAPATLNDFRHVTKHVWMSRSAMPATRNEATPHVKPPKVTPFFRTYQRHSHSDLARTVANGCGRLRTVADVNATSSEHTLNPQTPRVKREPLLRIREKQFWYDITINRQQIRELQPPNLTGNEVYQFIILVCL